MTAVDEGRFTPPLTPRPADHEPEGYSASIGGLAWVERSSRHILRVAGRSPGRMLNGLLSGTLPPELTLIEDGIWGGRTSYSALLTPKGKIVTDLRVARLENGEAGRFLLEIPGAGLDGALAHMKRYLPPRFARLEEFDDAMGVVTVIGPAAAAALEAGIPELGRIGSSTGDLREHEEFVLGPVPGPEVRVIRSGDAIPPAFDVIGSASTLDEVREGLVARGAVPASAETWETLRIERGRPAFGTELDEDTLPPEAGIEDRAIDHHKGCYTGQEVIVRIRDRGKVNRRLRGFLLGDAPPPVPGTPLFLAERQSPVGEVRSAIRSPRFGQTVALAFIRSAIDPGTSLRLGRVDGPSGSVRALDAGGWVLVDGDPPPVN